MNRREEFKRGILFSISAPSGAGKTTVASQLLGRVDNMRLSISHTTRPIRKGETDGVDYYFTDEERFRAMIENDEFVEWAEVHGNMYGTSMKAIDDVLNSNVCDLLLDIDVQGADTLRARKIGFTSIFILPPSMEELRKRLAARGTDTKEVVEKRLRAARSEMEQMDKFDYVVVNDDLDTAVDQALAVITAERLRPVHRRIVIK